MSSNEPRDQLAALLRDVVGESYDGHSQSVADVAIAAGWRPPPPVIEAGWDLLHLPIRTVLRDETTGALFEKRTGGFWHSLSGPQIGDAFTAGHRFTVLWEPEEAS